MIKVVYFDDQSAIDYLYIYDGGAKVQTSDKVKEKKQRTCEQGICRTICEIVMASFCRR